MPIVGTLHLAGPMEKFLRHKIANDGPITVAEFIKTVLTGRKGGYYMEKDVFGQKGDFITAPEISQLFGEMIALSFVKQLQLQEKEQKSVHLIEFGPGRGTLMSDMLRTFKAFPWLWSKVKKCSLIEVSPHLQQIQKQTLSSFSCIEFDWIKDVHQLKVERGSTLLFVAQEFFDALPVHVFKKSNDTGKWKELLVAWSSDAFGLIEADTRNINLLRLQQNFPDWPADKTLELSPESWSIAHRIRQIFNETGSRGEGIFIDYGRFGPSQHSLRAIYQHEFCPIFDHLGEADLSTDVDFQSLMHYLGTENKYQFATQGQFLTSMGIKERLEQLKKSNDSTLEASVNRLISEKEMGSIYKKPSPQTLLMVARTKKAPAVVSEPTIDPDESVILNYLNTQNRPYGVNDLFNNLHGAVGKTALSRALTSLAERGEITAKTCGKSIIYVARQDLLPVPSNEDLNALDDEIIRLKEEIANEKDANRQVQAKLSTMTSSLTTEDLKVHIKGLQAEVSEMHERLGPLERGTVKVDPEERARVEKDLDVYSKAHKQRKKMCMEIIGMLSESTGKRPAEIIEELGLEVDPV